MKVAGFTFIRNGVKYGYPFIQSIKSILPLVDEMVICVGDSEDTTNEALETLDHKNIKRVESVWDESLRVGGTVLAVETNKALDATSNDADWLFYIQGDEIVHEDDYDEIRKQMLRYQNDDKVDGLLFRYYHFYGSYSFLADGRSWYPFEIRVIKNDKRIRSYRDAQGFRWNDGRKLRVKLIDAAIYHYGWVRSPVIMNRKQTDFGSLYSGEAVKQEEEFAFDYSKIDTLCLFQGSHAAVMKDIIAMQSWDIDRDIRRKNFKNIKYQLYYFLDKRLGWRPFSYKNYRLVK